MPKPYAGRPKPYVDRPWWTPDVDEADLLKRQAEIIEGLKELLQEYNAPFSGVLDDVYTSARCAWLTGRRAWDKISDNWSRDGTIIVMLDLIDFKRINDEIGMEAGDDAIEEFGIALARECEDARKRVWPIHYGGDEFLVMLQASALDEFKAIFNAIKKWPITFENGQKWDVCASGGYWQADGVMKWDEVRALAEKACKRAKSAIKNPKNELLMYSKEWEAAERPIRTHCICGLQFLGSVAKEIFPPSEKMECPLCHKEISLNKAKAAQAPPR